MSLPKGNEVETQAQSSGAEPTPSADPCPSGDVPREGSRDIQQKGKIICVPYDWCKSKDSPVPYKIWAWQSSACNLANSVRQTDYRSHVLGSIVNQCYGDEPGTGGGVKSGTHNAECTPLTYSPTVRAEGRPMVRYLDKWHMNHGNTWGCLNNPEDMGKYDTPKVASIDDKMVAQVDDDVCEPEPAWKKWLFPPVNPFQPQSKPAPSDQPSGAPIPTSPPPSVPVTGSDTGSGIYERAYAKSRAKALAAAQVKPIPWVRITQNPCLVFACPIAPLPSYQYKGGTYNCTKGGGKEGHHTPAASASYLPYGAGPSVQMEPSDHAMTASNGSGANAAIYRAGQAGMISSDNFMGAVAEDVKDLQQTKFHHKYDGAITQMLLYANCLKQNGFVR